MGSAAAAKLGSPTQRTRAHRAESLGVSRRALSLCHPWDCPAGTGLVPPQEPGQGSWCLRCFSADCFSPVGPVPICWSHPDLNAGAQQRFLQSVALFLLSCGSSAHADEVEAPPHFQPCPRQSLSVPCSFSCTFPVTVRLSPPLQCIPWKQAHRRTLSGFLFYLRYVFGAVLLFQMNTLIHSEVQFLFLNQQSCLCSQCP